MPACFELRLPRIHLITTAAEWDKQIRLASIKAIRVGKMTVQNSKYLILVIAREHSDRGNPV